MDGEGSRIDYEHELGNGWNRYQIMVLGELKRLADQNEKVTTLLQAHEIHFAALTEQNRQRDQVLETLVNELKTLRDDHDGLREEHDDLIEQRGRSNVRMKLGMKAISIAVAALAWCATTGLSIYAVFFHGSPPPSR